MASLIPRLQSHLALTALAVLTTLGPPIGHPAQEVLESRSLQTTGAGRTFYVAPGGSDSADGSIRNPWATIRHADRAVAPGDTVYVAPGQYNAPVTTNTSGRAGAPITFISTTQWGATINTTGSGNQYCWNNYGNYVTIQGFDISAPGDTVARIGIVNWGSYCNIIGNHVHDIPGQSSPGNGGAGIDNANYSGGHNNVIGNVVGNVGVKTSSVVVQGIYSSGYGDNIWNNIVYGISDWGVQGWHAATNTTIANNLVFSGVEAAMAAGESFSATVMHPGVSLPTTA